MKYDDTKYIEAVKKCTLLVKQRNELKYEIVKIALSVCFIKKGNNTSIRHYSLSAFAKDIGIPIGTLSRWKLEYENVIMKINLKKEEKLNKHALNQTMRKVTASSTEDEVKKIYKRHLDSGYSTPEDKTLRVYTQRLKSMHFFICYSAVLEKLNEDDLNEVELYCSEMLKSIQNKKQRKIKKPNKVILKKAINMAKG